MYCNIDTGIVAMLHVYRYSEYVSLEYTVPGMPYMYCNTGIVTTRVHVYYTRVLVSIPVPVQ